MQSERHNQYLNSLLELREHYQAQLEEYLGSSAHVREQLTHVNDLLVDHLVENQHFVENLMGLRDHYQALLEEYSRTQTHAREQLTHINALLVDQLVLPDNQQPVSMQASTVTTLQPNQSITEPPPKPISASPNDAQTTVGQLLTRSEAADIASKESYKEPDSQDSPSSASELDSTDSQDEPKEPTSLTPTQIVESDPAQRTVPSFKESGSLLGKFPAQKTAMLLSYKHLTKLQAVKTLLRENAGSILHVDYIIRALYGELDTNAMRAEKPRMYDTLSKGTSQGLWDKVPDQASCYTIDLKLVAPELISKESAQQNKVRFHQKRLSRSKSSSVMLPPYQQLNLIDAIELIVRENSGQILNRGKVAQALYGDLSGQAFIKAKERVGRALGRGANQKRWQRVPGQIGHYTLDLKLVDPELAK